MAGLYPGAVIIEIMRDDGEMARVPDLLKLCEKHHIKMCSVRQIIEHRLAKSSIVQRLDPVAGTPIRTPYGDFTLTAFRSLVDPLPHLALTVGGVGRLDDTGQVIETPEPTLVRVHRRDLLGDIFHDLDSSTEGSTGETLQMSMREIQQAGRGAIVYLRPTTTGNDWRDRLQRPSTHREDDTPRNSVPPAMVEYGTGSQILRALGLTRLRLLTNSTTPYPQIEAFGLEIVERVPLSQ
jgi:3,4-dihydroxy 2-butanone 4-phosphate synthase/GTP cyclohydrolase II